MSGLCKEPGLRIKGGSYWGARREKLPRMGASNAKQKNLESMHILTIYGVDSVGKGSVKAAALAGEDLNGDTGEGYSKAVLETRVPNC